VYVNPYINGDGREVVVTPDGSYTYCSTANACVNVPMGVYNIADKSVSPTEIGRFYENTGEEPQPWEMEISPNGCYHYAVTVYDGFLIYDLATPSNPQLMAFMARPSIHDISLEYTNKTLYIRNFIEDSSICAYDVSDPTCQVWSTVTTFLIWTCITVKLGYTMKRKQEIYVLRLRSSNEDKPRLGGQTK
jgi:hypothetical protein